MTMPTPSRRDVLKSGTAFAVGALAATPLVSAIAAPSASDLTIAEIKTFAMEDGIFVKVVTDSGVVGWGECDAGANGIMEAFIHTELARHVVGRDPFDTEPNWERMFYRNHDFGPGGALANAISGIDIALWDIKGRVLDVPIYRLLGGKYRDWMPVYGSYGTGRWSRMTPKQAADQAEKFVGEGFKTVKCRMQIRESHLNPVADRTIDYVDTIKKRIKDEAELFVDINNGYSAKRAIQIGRILQDDYGMRFYEEPCSDQNHSETAQVVRALDMAVIAGEKEYTPWQLAELIQYADPDFLNPDVIKAGGITGMDKISVLSQVSQKPMILHNTRPTLSTAASLQLVASIPTIGPFLEYPDVDRFPDLIATMVRPLDYDDGALKIPDGPGLGVDIDEARVQARSTSVKVFRKEG